MNPSNPALAEGRKPQPQARQQEPWRAPQIMATLGPTLEKQEDLHQAILAGVRWVRIPCGYRQRPHLENARAARAAAARAGVEVQLLLDLPSSRPRTGTMPDLVLRVGDKVVFWDPAVEAESFHENGACPVPLPGLRFLLDRLAPSNRLWFCDGHLNFVVDEIHGGFVNAHLVEGAIALKSSNSIFLPDSRGGFDPVTEPDRVLFREFAAANLLPDWVALSLVASPEDVRSGRAEARKHLQKEVRVMAKFETEDAVERAEAILAEADGIMVARGDLALAVGYARLPGVQESLVQAAREAGKPVVVATQILEIFAAGGVPQRAELSDLSVIARQRADAIMLGKETVFSPRPLECIRLAREILEYETHRFAQAYGT